MLVGCGSTPPAPVTSGETHAGATWRTMSGAEFDVDREIAAITLNRWPHGYAYEFEGVGVPLEYDRYNGPHIRGRARIGRISIANSDSEAYAYVNGAIDAADRAVNEQLS